MAEDPNETPSCLSTKPELIRAAQAAGVKVSAWQLQEWELAGLLPTPIRTKLPGQARGRAPYRYPDPALDAVIWLGTHRRFIEGDDVARLWMWLEGFDHVTPDVHAVVLARIEALWHDGQNKMPSLPEVAEVAEHGLSDELRQRLLDELDANVTGPMLATGEWDDRTAAHATSAASLLGIIPAEWVVAYTEQHGSPAEALLDTTQAPVQANLAAFAAGWPNVQEAAQLTRVYGLVKSKQLDPAIIRATWQLFTPQTLPGLWPVMALFPSLCGVHRPKDRGEFMRFLQYDPLDVVVLAAMIGEAVRQGEQRH